MISEYVDALCSQIDAKLAEFDNLALESVYFGGGTPSMLKISDFEKIFKKISPYIDTNTEITVEANPSSWGLEKAKSVFSMGANRLSLGVQSLNDEKLSFLSRVHDSKSALIAYGHSITAGFSNISVDFMYDTKFDDEKFVEEELNAFLALNAMHISAYSLTIEDGTPFEKNKIATRYDADMAQKIAATIKQAGYEHYEVASFGKMRSKHNFGYWEYKKYIGVGAGAVGFDGQRRLYPHKKIEDYIKNPFFADTEELSIDDMRAEKILLGLRSAIGVPKNLLTNNKETVGWLVENGVISEVDDKIICNDFFVADEVAARLL